MSALKYIQSMKRFHFGFFCGLFLVLFSSCEYVSHEALPEDFRTIYIASFLNDTGDGDLPVSLREEIIDGFKLDGRLVPVMNREKADILLALKLYTFTIKEVTYTVARLPDEMYMYAELKYVLQNIGTKEVIRDLQLESGITYFLVTEPVKTELDVRQELVEDIAGKIVISVIEGFY